MLKTTNVTYFMALWLVVLINDSSKEDHFILFLGTVKT